MIRSLYLFIFLIFSQLAYTQGTINAPKYTCIGSLLNLSYTPPSGLTLSSANWDFGDGNSSSSNSPSHSYGLNGKYKISINANLSNGTNRIDTAWIDVYSLPNAKMYFVTSSDTCLSRNLLCYVDTSKPANNNQPIKQRLIVWGDGSFDTKSDPKYGETICHNYTVPDKYNLKIEITDTFGCKSSFNTIKSVADDIVTFFDDTMSFFDCNTMQICVVNKSVGATPATSHYKWVVNGTIVDTGFHFTQKCFYFNQSGNIKLQLVAHANNACRDTTTRNFNVVVDSLPTFMTIQDTIRCFGDENLNLAQIRPVNCEDYIWYMDNVPFVPRPHGPNRFFSTRVLPGVHVLRVDIYRGSCIHSVFGYFRVIGPVSRIRAVDDKQCFSNRQVYFIQNSLGDTQNQIYHWYIHDALGKKCVNERTKGINLYENCTESLDWYTKYKYSPGAGSLNEVSLVVEDTVTGCRDSNTINVDMKNCSKILQYDTLKVCQGDILYDNIPPPYPYKFSIDSGKTWLKYPKVMDSTFSGFYDIGFIFETEIIKWVSNFGNDSIKIHNDTITYYDTIFRKQLLYVIPPKDEVATVKIYNKCSPFRASVYFDKGQFLKDEKLYVVWGDNGNIELDFTKDTIIDSVFHIYNRSGFSAEIQIFITNANGCVTRLKVPVQMGKAMSSSTPSFLNCLNNKVCFYPGVYDFKKNTFWSSNSPTNYIRWRFPDTNQLDTNFVACYKYKKPGMQPYEMIVTDDQGCVDTLRDSIFLQDVRAGIKFTNKVVYCSELKQFFDSSTYLLNPPWRFAFPYEYYDTIKRHLWQFGDGTFSSVVKNPLQSLNTSLDRIPAAHVVETVRGCTDTIRFEIEVIGPKPYFLIKDTIGCGSLEAEFVNLSKNCKQYIWRFGDSANSSQQVDNKNNIKFIYNKPGRYYISLVGIDTVYNPFTKSFQSCFNTFPDKLFQLDTNRSVLVLPLNKTGIQSIDTVCVNAPIVFKSLSDTAYKFESWSLGDSTFIVDTIVPSNVRHTYSKIGNYLVKLNPRYIDTLRNTCLDSSSKTIYVIGVESKFSIDPSSKAPQFYFTNESDPLSARMLWDFDHMGSTSTDVNTQYNYGRDTGTFNVCLVASIPYGCADTFCLPVTNQYLADFGIYNVFTPGNDDALNTSYDIVIDGENYYHLQIYDRWGIKVFESFKDDEGNGENNWNGKVNNQGAECPDGTYYYLFEYGMETESERKVISGVITLIR